MTFIRNLSVPTKECSIMLTSTAFLILSKCIFMDSYFFSLGKLLRAATFDINITHTYLHSIKMIIMLE